MGVMSLPERDAAIEALIIELPNFYLMCDIAVLN